MLHKNPTTEKHEDLMEEVENILKNGRATTLKGLIKKIGRSKGDMIATLAKLGAKGKVKRQMNGRYVHLSHNPSPARFYPK